MKERRNGNLFDWLFFGLLTCLSVVFALGLAREHRISTLSAPIEAGISPGLRAADAVEIARRVAARFRYVDEHGPVGRAAPWPLRTDADYLLVGGDCGAAAAAIAAIFVSRRVPFRIVQVNVVAGEASHIMVEALDDGQHWVLLEPLGGHGFPSQLDGLLLGIDAIRALPSDQRGWLGEDHRTGAFSLYNPYRRTNWARLGPLADVVRAVAGDEAMRETSITAVMMKAERWLAEAALLAMTVLVATRLLAPMLKRIKWRRIVRIA